MSKRIGIYPGTFDPITVGHVDIITRALPMVDRLIIGVAKYSDKDPLFHLEDRVKMVQEEIDNLDMGGFDVEIEVEPFEKLLVDFARSKGSIILIRGLRAVSDFEYEFKMASMNGRIAPEIETVFLMASDKCQFVSSRFIKEISKLGGDVSQFVSPHVNKQLNEKYRKDKL